MFMDVHSIEADNAEDANTVHREAHGLVADQRRQLTFPSQNRTSIKKSEANRRNL